MVLPLSRAVARRRRLANSGSQTHIPRHLQLSNSMLSDNRGTYVSWISTHTSDKPQQATLYFNDYATKLSNHTLCKATHDGFCVEISQTTSRLDRKQKWLHACAACPCVAAFHQSWTSVSVTNSQIAFQITKISTFSTQ